MLQNARVTAFTVSELLWENQQGVIEVLVFSFLFYSEMLSANETLKYLFYNP